MKYLKLIGEIDIQPILESITEYSKLFGLTTVREHTKNSPHHDTQTIFLRMPYNFTPEAFFNDLQVTDYPLMTDDRIYDTVQKIKSLAHADIARAMIVRLSPNGHIDAHIDQGPYAEATDRYHLCITTNDKCAMIVADEMVFAKAGELWFFDKHQKHEVYNDGTTDRLHLIVDCWKD